MKHMYLFVALTFGSLSLNAMERESRIKLSEQKLIKMSDWERESHQKLYKFDIIGNSVGAAIYSTAFALLAFKNLRQSPQARIIWPFTGVMAMMHTFFLYKDVKKYNYAKYGLKEHRELVVE
jgi:hypothetical protein